MIQQLFFPGLLDTCQVSDRLMVVRDGFVNFYVIKTLAGLLCFDTGWSTKGVTRGFETLGLETRDVAAVFLTHAHWDHARCLGLYTNAEIFVGEHEEAACLGRWCVPTQSLSTLSDGQSESVAGITVQTVYTPGHTLGSVSYIVGERLLFVGDTLRLRQSEVLPFFTVFNYDSDALIHSIKRLASIDGLEYLLTAHSGVCSDLAKAFNRWRDPLHLERAES